MARAFRNHLLGACAAGTVVLLFCLLLLRHDPRFFWVDDYQISILPVFADVARSWSEGHWPLLSPYSWACGNLAGEFQYGTFSVFVNAAVILIWKFPLAFWHQAAALSIAHLFVLAMGAYLLARARDLSPPLSLMVAIVASLNGWMICWGASDWFGALAAFAWLPWSWWALEKAVQPEGPRWRLLLPAPFIYLLMAGGFPYTIGMLALVTTWLGLRALLEQRDWRAPFRLTSGWVLGLGLSAPAWMSLLEISPGSRRSVEVFVPNQWTVPLSALPGLVLPSWTVNWHQFETWIGPHSAVELACGFAPIVILIAAACTMPKRLFAKLRWEIGLLVIVLLLCVLPSAGRFRFSFRWLALFHLILVLIAAEAMRLCNQQVVRRLLSPSLFAVLVLGATWLGASLLGLTTPKADVNLPPIFLSCAIIWWFGDLFLQGRGKSWLPPIISFATLLTTYLGLNPHAPVAHYDFSENLNSAAPLDPNRLYLSLYLAPQSWYRVGMPGGPFGALVRPGSTSMFGGVHLVNGYTPVAPAGVARFFNCATHGQVDPVAIREIAIPEAGTGGLLEQLGIDGVIVAHNFQLPAPLPNEWKLAYSDAEGSVYHRERALPSARALVDENHGEAKIEIIENSRQRVVAHVLPNESSRSVLIAFSRPYFPGYNARLNGEALPVATLRGLAPTVEIPPGKGGRLELVYRPRAVVWGSCLAAFTTLTILIWLKRLV